MIILVPMELSSEAYWFSWWTSDYFFSIPCFATPKKDRRVCTRGHNDVHRYFVLVSSLMSLVLRFALREVTACVSVTVVYLWKAT